MNTHRDKLILTVLFIYMLLSLMMPLTTAQASAIDLDARGGYYSGSILRIRWKCHVFLL